MILVIKCLQVSTSPLIQLIQTLACVCVVSGPSQTKEVMWSLNCTILNQQTHSLLMVVFYVIGNQPWNSSNCFDYVWL